MVEKTRELKPGKKVCIFGRTYKDKIPESVIEDHKLKDTLFVDEKNNKPVQGSHQNKLDSKK